MPNKDLANTIINLPPITWSCLAASPLAYSFRIKDVNQPEALPPHIFIKEIRLRQFSAFAAAACLCAVAISPARAHPHVWVTARAEMIFDATGKVTALRHSWTFDEAYSSFQVQGLGTDGKMPTREQLAPLAKVNMDSLAEFGYFTVLKVGGKAQDMGAPSHEHLDVGADKLVTLTYDLPLSAPVAAKPAMTLQVYDPEFFVQFDFAPQDAVTLIGAPNGCSNSSSKPKELEAADAQRLKDVANTNESPGVNFGIKLATRIIVACP